MIHVLTGAFYLLCILTLRPSAGPFHPQRFLYFPLDEPPDDLHTFRNSSVFALCVFLLQVCCSEFMEFADVENLHDFYSSEGGVVHTQDHRGFYVVYDAALKDLEELENELLLVGSHFIQRNTIKELGNKERADACSRAGTDFDRVAVLLDLWTCETEFLENKVQVQ